MDFKQNKMLKLPDQVFVNSAYFQQSKCGHLLLTYQQIPTCFRVLDSDSLSVLYTINHKKYCPFMELPLKHPVELQHVIDSELIFIIPGAKVVVMETAIKGLSLSADSTVMLVPVWAPCSSQIAFVHMYITNTFQRSEVEVHDLTCVLGQC